MKKVTVNDLAKISGYSQPTVSRALNDSNLISVEVKQKIQELAKKMNYRPNIAARSLAGQKTGIIGFYIFQMEHAMHPTLSQVLQGATRVAAEEGYNLLLVLTDEDTNKGEVAARNYLDGILVPTQETTEEEIKFLESQNIPFVLLNREPDEKRYVVNIDYEKVAMDITEHLSSAGHRRIAYLSGPEDFWINRALLKGYRKASEQFLGGLQCIRFGDWSEEEGYKLASELLELPNHPTAFFGEDFLIAGALRAIKERGLRVPKDVALVGINDVPLISSLDPPISSMRLPMDKLGEEAAGLLIKLLSGKKAKKQVLLPGELIIRESSKQEFQEEVS